jgi:beta-glucuronidase
MGIHFATTAALLLGAAAVLPAQPARTLSLDGHWLFATDPQRTGEQHRWFELSAPLRWDEITVPHCWPVDPRFQYTGAAWYRRHFLTPTGWNGLHVRLRFEAVFYRAHVWVNGNSVGFHEGGYTPFELDITRFLKPAGEDNLLAVEVDNSWDTTTLPGARPGPSSELEMYPWWDYGGIVRDVGLIASATAFPIRQKIEAVPDLGSGAATVKATVWVENAGSEWAEVDVSAGIVRNGESAWLSGAASARKVRVAPFDEAAVTFEWRLAKPEVQLWYPDSPALYELRTVAGDDRLVSAFGIRRIEIRGSELLLNGEPIRMGGANRPADDPVFGLIEPESVVNRDLRLMKEAGLELARHIHYAPAPAILDWADRNGMLLILEGGNWQLAPAQMDSPVIRAKWQSQMREMIERDWNHPSVIGWSVGNEFASDTPSGIRWVRDGRRFVRSLDSSRFVTFASNHAALASNSKPTDEASGEVDLIMVNTYASPDKVGVALDHVHELWPDKPVLISEFGVRYDGVSVSGVHVSSDAEGRAEQYFHGFFAALRTRPWICGASLWTFNDYRSRFPGTNPNGYRWWGVVDGQRNKRPAYEWVRQELSPAILGDARAEAGAITVAVSTRSDFPSYTLRGYRLRWKWLDTAGREISHADQSLPDLAPGWQRSVTMARPAGSSTLHLEVIRPTGFSMVDRKYDLARK